MTVGFIGGKFLPLHLGHVYAIVQASSIVDELYVVLSHSELRDRQLCQRSKMDYIPPQIRLRWLSQLTKDMTHVKVISIQDDQGNEDYNWAEGGGNIKRQLESTLIMSLVQSMNIAISLMNFILRRNTN